MPLIYGFIQYYFKNYTRAHIPMLKDRIILRLFYRKEEIVDRFRVLLKGHLQLLPGYLCNWLENKLVLPLAKDGRL